MNEQRLDEMFREKLAGYSEMPSPEAGRKLSNRLKEQKRGVWIQFARLAAVIALIAVSVYVVQSWNDTAQDEGVPQVMSINKPAKNAGKEMPQPDQALLEKSSTQKINTPDFEEQGVNNLIKESSIINTHKQPERQRPVSEVAEPTLALTDEHKDILKNESIGKSPDTEQVSDPETETLIPSKPKVTITYIKSPAPPEPTLALQTTPEKKSKGFKRLWRKAQRINYNDISLAGIRAKKDQLLAFNRKKSKSN